MRIADFEPRLQSAIRTPQSAIMKTVIIGGQARDIGKTTVITSIIAATPDYNWTAVKITGFGPAEQQIYGDRFALEEEHTRGAATDSSRFLAAGARRAFWLRVPVGKLADAMPAFHEAVARAENLIIESNSILEFVDPDLYLMILDPARTDFKETARKFFDRANAYLVIQDQPGEIRNPPAKRDEIRNPFRLARDRRITPELIDFIKANLEEAA
jgi:hypothetical protein